MAVDAEHGKMVAAHSIRRSIQGELVIELLTLQQHIANQSA